MSIKIAGGEKEVGSLAEPAAIERDKDILYIPFPHYMNVWNPPRHHYRELALRRLAP